ncbi:MAG: crotonobetainyl-CoA:carnitine CoA-transferase CaiB-like acyl-CoA transferase [Gammaproteobacteria bacterium]
MALTTEQSENHSVRVGEFVGCDSGVASAYAGWLLKRLGAQVTRFRVGTGGDIDGQHPEQLALEVLSEGKSEGPNPTNAAEFDVLLAEIDVLLCDTLPELLAIAGTLSSIRLRHPRLVIGMATIFGLDGPYAQYPATGLDAQALSGVAWSLGEPDREPLSFPPGIAEHQAGAMLAAASLLALQVRDECGSGRIVDVALADVLASYVAANCRLYISHGLRWHRGGRRASGSGGAYPYVILPCKDGEVCIFGRTPEEWQRLVNVMGNPAWTSEPRYQDLRAMGQQYPEEVDELLKPWLAERTKAELEIIALDNSLILSPIRDFADVLATRQFKERKYFRQLKVAGTTVTAPGLPFRIRQSRTESASNIAENLLLGAAPISVNPPTPSNSRPLAGMRVLDFGWVWSAPWVGTILAEFGAEVIKVEHSGRPDNLRLAGRIIRAGKKVEGPSKEMSPMFHQINHGKLGITLNAKKPRAVELLKRLMEVSDVVVENMSPGTMERTGLGYDVLREVNPRAVMLSMSAAGQFGSLSGMRAYAPNMSSAAGLESLVGYRGEAPIGSLSFGLGDPNASAHALTAVLAALRRARLTGKGCYIDLSQIEALLGTLRPYILDSQIKAAQPGTLGNAHPQYAPHGIYPALENDAWLTLAIRSEDEWNAFRQFAPDASWALNSKFATNAGRISSVNELDADLASWTATHARDTLVEEIRKLGIASSPVLSIDEQWKDPHYAARGIKHTVDIPVYGNEDLFSAPWKFSDFASQINRCGPLTGEHNEQILGGLLGLSRNEIDELIATGVVG